MSVEGEKGRQKSRALNLETSLCSLDLIWPKNASDKNNKWRSRGLLLLCLGPRMLRLHLFGGEAPNCIPQQKARVRKGLCLMYELWLAIVSHPRTSCRQNKNLLWLIRKTGRLWIDCTQPGHSNINSNDSGAPDEHSCLYEITGERQNFNMESAEIGWLLILDNLRVLTEISIDAFQRGSFDLSPSHPSKFH